MTAKTTSLKTDRRTLVSNIITLFLGSAIALRLDKYSAGIYSSAESILNALFLIPNTVSFVIVPVLSHLFATDVRQAWKTAWRSLLVL